MPEDNHDHDMPAPVRAWREPVSLPTYPVPAPDRNPLFLEKRVYQGSSGKVYPLPFTDRLSDECVERTYTAAYLENEYICLMVLPEMGGRIHRGFDKTNNYDFIYHNTVIKPALVGLAGPWISGGIEFNWPQHHRPTTFQPVDHVLEENADGSRTIWVGEIEPMNHTKGMAGITLHPGRSYLEVKVRLYNRTPYPQTFLWWANLAVHANDNYQALFPPDVHFVADHAKRALSDFPLATGTYYGIDYSRGVDLSWFKNIPVPTSYMAVSSAYDFLGGYDHGRQAGIVHIANHHISPGKKQWTWGAGDFGRRWYDNLTDRDGPYIELMTGVFTDNQPDFAWLQPYETKTFSQYWYPLRALRAVKNANLEAAVNLEAGDEAIFVGLNTTARYHAVTATLRNSSGVIWATTLDVAPDQPFVQTAPLAAFDHEELTLTVNTADGRELIRYTERPSDTRTRPEPASAAALPAGIETNESLYLTGLHLEQYRHATTDPELYYQEALRRDPHDARSNNALGLLYLRQGDFQQAARHFSRAIATLTQKNPNPYDGEPYYNLGVALHFLERPADAYEAFYKAAWNYAWQAASYYQLAELDCRAGNLTLALEHVERSLATNTLNLKAHHLKAGLLRRLDRPEEARETARLALAVDPLDYGSRQELYYGLKQLGAQAEADQVWRELQELLRDQPQSYLNLAIDYAGAGLWAEAIEVLARLLQSAAKVDPLVYYHLAYYHEQNGAADVAENYYRQAAQVSPDYVFPNRLESIGVLSRAQQVNPGDARAPYYLGNLLYDKRRHAEAIRLWEKSSTLDANFSIVQRNLGLAYYNVEHDAQKAQAAYRQAFTVNPQDARLLFELDQLDKRLNLPPQERLNRLEVRLDLVEQRDDLTVEWITLLNQSGQYDRALQQLERRHFHPWEGGEGKVTEQYLWAYLLRGRAYLDNAQAADALQDFLATLTFPENLGEGRHEVFLAEAQLFYHLGLAYEALGNAAQATAYFGKAAAEDKPDLEKLTYRGLALIKLQRPAEARQKFQQLIAAGTERLNAPARIDYFAISLPAFLVFEDDLARRNAVDGHYWRGLGYLGLGDREQARSELEAVRALDVNHLGAQFHLTRLV